MTSTATKSPNNPITEPFLSDAQPLTHVPRQDPVENLLKFQLDLVRQLVETP